MTEQHIYQKNDIVCRKNKTDGTIYRIIEVCEPASNFISLRDFVKINPTHKVSKKFFDKQGKQVRYPRWNQFIDVDNERVLSKLDAYGGVRLEPIVTLNFTVSKKRTRKTTITNRSWLLKNGVQSAHKELIVVNVLDVLYFQEKIARAVKSFAEHMPGDTMEKIS